MWMRRGIREFVFLHDANPLKPTARMLTVDNISEEVNLDLVFDDIISLIAERNSGFYHDAGGVLTHIR